MPELPEVETIARDLRAAGLPGRVLSCARVSWPRTVAEPDAAEFCRRVAGRRIESVGRRGKFLVITLAGGGHLLLHLRMSGRLDWCEPGAPRSPHEHVVLAFTDGRELRFHDTRKFGRLYLTEDAGRILGKLGPEPFAEDFTASAFQRALGRRRRRVKPLLLDQGFLAGLGNIYTDEALWEAGIHPARRADTLAATEAHRLHRAIRRVLRRGLENLGTSLGTGKANYYSVGGRRGRNRDALRVFRRTGEPCPRCGTPIVRIILHGRGTHLCPRCQPERG
ncbi:MAG: DNA-formamidopyrimidine glycosylase [Desulfobacterales bacterium]